MSTLAVTTVTTGNSTTDQTLTTGNTTAGKLVMFSNGFGIALGGNSSTNTALLSPNGHIVFANSTANTLTLTSAGNMTIGGNMIMASSFMRNRIINGNMYIAQRATSATVTAGTTVPTASTGYPACDRWFVYSTGANVTAAQVAGSGSNKNVLQITGAASVTAVGIGQRIESLNSYDLANTTCTLAVDISNSLLTTVTWTAYYATTTADTFGTIGTPTKTSIATGTFTVTSTLTRYTANISVPAAATTGIEILFTVGAQISGTWQIGNVQFETGSVATPYERRQYGQELMLCQRYLPMSQIAPATGYSIFGSCYSTTGYQGRYIFQTTPRVPPTGIVATTVSGFLVNDSVNVTTATSVVFTGSDYGSCLISAAVASGLTQFRFATLTTTATSSQIQFTGCEIP